MRVKIFLAWNLRSRRHFRLCHCKSISLTDPHSQSYYEMWSIWSVEFITLLRVSSFLFGISLNLISSMILYNVEKAYSDHIYVSVCMTAYHNHDTKGWLRKNKNAIMIYSFKGSISENLFWIKRKQSLESFRACVCRGPATLSDKDISRFGKRIRLNILSKAQQRIWSAWITLPEFSIHRLLNALKESLDASNDDATSC